MASQCLRENHSQQYVSILNTAKLNTKQTFICRLQEFFSVKDSRDLCQFDNLQFDFKSELKMKLAFPTWLVVLTGKVVNQRDENE